MNELMISIVNDGKEPLYQQIYNYIRTNIADGKISCGERLPSTRFLARHLQISRSTVELAYDQLTAEGYIESVPYRGYFANDISELYLGTEHEKHREESLHTVLHKEEKAEKYLVNFSPNKVDLKYFPYGTWRKISKAILSEDDPELFSSGEKMGEYDLREAIGKYLYQARGVNCRAEQIVIGAGNEYLLMLLCQILSNTEKIAMENPTYLQAYRMFTNLKYTVAALPMDEAGIDLEELKKSEANVVYTMPSHQFPVGIVMPMKRRYELLHWANEKKDRYIIEDDHDSEFRYKGKPIPALQSSDRNGKVIYLGTFSKSIAPATRVSYMVLPEELLHRFYEVCGSYACTVPKVQQLILREFMEAGNFERHLNRMRGIYRAKHDNMLGLLKKENWVSQIYGDYAGMHLLVEVKSHKKEAEIVSLAKKSGIKIDSLAEYRIPGAQKSLRYQKPTLLLGYGALEAEDMKKGIEILRELM